MDWLSQTTMSLLNVKSIICALKVPCKFHNGEMGEQNCWQKIKITYYHNQSYKFIQLGKKLLSFSTDDEISRVSIRQKISYPPYLQLCPYYKKTLIKITYTIHNTGMQIQKQYIKASICIKKNDRHRATRTPSRLRKMKWYHFYEKWNQLPVSVKIFCLLLLLTLC